MTPLALLRRYLHNDLAVFNSAAGFSSPIITADNRLSAVFFRPSFTIGTPFFRRAMVGSLRAAGFRDAGLLTLLSARHPFSSGYGSNHHGGHYA